MWTGRKSDFFEIYDQEPHVLIRQPIARGGATTGWIRGILVFTEPRDRDHYRIRIALVPSRDSRTLRAQLEGKEGVAIEDINPIELPIEEEKQFRKQISSALALFRTAGSGHSEKDAAGVSITAEAELKAATQLIGITAGNELDTIQFLEDAGLLTNASSLALDVVVNEFEKNIGELDKASLTHRLEAIFPQSKSPAH